MRPTFMGFETAKTSIFANQKSIDIVGNNLANLDTNGYTRQRVDRVSVVVASSAGRVSQNRVGLMGQGVEALGVSQLRDSYLDQRFREEYANTAYHNEATDILKDIQSVFDDGNDVSSMTGLTDAMEKIFDSIQDFAQDPTSSTTANIVMSAFVNMTQVLNQLDSKLQNVLEQQSSDMKVTTDRVNQLLQQVAQLNKTISDQDMSLLTGTESYQPNELLDERNLILDELAGYGDIQVTQKADGSVDVVMGGVSVVTGDSFNTLNYVQHDDGTVALTWRNGGENAQFTSGALKADLEFINGRGTNVQSSNETPQKGIPYYRDKINTYANAMAYVVNHSIPEWDANKGAPATDADGNIIYKTLLAAKQDNGKTSNTISITAGNITISDEWRASGGDYFVVNPDEADPKYAQSIATNLTQSDFTFKSFGETFTGTFEEFSTDIVSTLGSEISYQQNRAEATSSVTNDFLARRDEVSGVSRDEETANLLQYQKSYEAAARVMNVMDELLDVIINQMGL